MTDDQLNRMEAAARAVGPQQWYLAETDGDFWVYREDDNGNHVINVGEERIQACGIAFDPIDKAVGEHIAAANPAAVQALIAQLRALREAAGGLLSEAVRWDGLLSAQLDKAATRLAAAMKVESP